MTESLMRFSEGVGHVGLLLIGLGVYLSTTLFLRGWTLRRGDRRTVQDILRSPREGDGALVLAASTVRDCAPGDRLGLDQALGAIRRRLPLFRRTVRTLCATAPMLGLLGTVSGMIQTFDALGAAGGREDVASGISQALLTTELGLALAIPGLLVSRLLDSWQLRLSRDLDALQAEVLAGWRRS